MKNIFQQDHLLPKGLLYKEECHEDDYNDGNNDDDDDDDDEDDDGDDSNDDDHDDNDNDDNDDDDDDDEINYCSSQEECSFSNTKYTIKLDCLP